MKKEDVFETINREMTELSLEVQELIDLRRRKLIDILFYGIEPAGVKKTP